MLWVNFLIGGFFFLFHKLKFLFIKVSILDTFTANTIMVNARDSTYTTTPIRAFFRSSTQILISALIERRITYETIFPFKNALIGVHHPFLIRDFWDLVEPTCPGCFTYNFFLGLGFLLTSSPILRICREKKISSTNFKIFVDKNWSFRQRFFDKYPNPTYSLG